MGETKPDITLLVQVPPEVSADRLRSRQANLPFVRDRIEEADRAFFERVDQGYQAIAAADPDRIKIVNGAHSLEDVSVDIWSLIEPRLPGHC